MERSRFYCLTLVFLSILIVQRGESCQVLWDFSHGRLCPIPGLPCDTFHTPLFRVLEEEGISVVQSEVGLQNEDLSQFDVLVISFTGSMDFPYTPEEVTLIEDFVLAGGGLFILGDHQSFGAGAENLNPVSQRFGVTMGTPPGIAGRDPVVPIIEHPIFIGVSQIKFGVGSDLIVQSPSIPAAVEDALDSLIGIAVAQSDNERIVISGDESMFYQDMPPDPCCLFRLDNQTFARNVFRWLCSPPCEPVEPPIVKTQGYWRRQCMEKPHEDICAYAERIHVLSDHFDDYDCDDICNLMEADPPENDMCRKAERQFMALLLNVASGKLELCNCLEDGRTVEEVISEIETLLTSSSNFVLRSPSHDLCERAKTLSDELNNGNGIVDCQSNFSPVTLSSTFYTTVPNPFFNSTLIQYESPIAQSIQLKIYDLMGRLVQVLVNEDQGSGFYRVEWKGLDESGQRVPSGIYFSRLRIGKIYTTLKLVILK